MSLPWHLYIIEPSGERAVRLRAEFASFANVTVADDYAQAAEISGGLDALYISLMSAIEWGSIPIPAPVYETRVIEMPARYVANGRPRYAIPGVAMNTGDERDAISTTRLVLRESFRAIASFNRSNTQQLQKVCAVSGSLGFDKLKEGEARELLLEVGLT